MMTKLYVYDFEIRDIVNRYVHDIKRDGGYLLCQTNPGEEYWTYPIDAPTMEDFCESEQEFIDKWHLVVKEIRVELKSEKVEEKNF